MMALNTHSFTPSVSYTKHDRDRLTNDPRRLTILYEYRLPGRHSVESKVLVDDYPFAVATYFSASCAQFVRDNPLLLLHRAGNITRASIVVRGAPHEFQHYQEVFRFIFDFYCHGTATVIAGRPRLTNLNIIRTLAKILGVKILMDQASLQIDGLTQYLPTAEDARWVLKTTVPGDPLRKHLVNALSYHVFQGTLPRQCGALRDLFRDPEFSRLMDEYPIHNPKTDGIPTPRLTRQQIQELKDKGWVVDEDGRPLLEESPG